MENGSNIEVSEVFIDYIKCAIDERRHIKKHRPDIQAIYEYVSTNFALKTDLEYVTHTIKSLEEKGIIENRPTKHGDSCFVLSESVKSLYEEERAVDSDGIRF